MTRTFTPIVLVVDDDPELRVLLETCLRVEGFDVRTAQNGSDALSVAQQTTPCLILLDLMMPVMDGIEFRRRQQRAPALRDVPVVCLSAHHNARQTAASLGFDDCLGKPFDLDHLIAVVRRHCRETPAGVSPGSSSFRPAES
jgi:DNA-binding response OmpR family regulator